ncbi:MAG: type IV pilus assembly protein PilM [bacterium]|nr:type IV pilus assembly protein PilM [bacterium]
MTKAKNGIGLDIGSNSVKVVELVKTPQGIELKNANIVSIKAKDGRAKEENILSALTEAIAPFEKLTKSQLVVSMPGRSVIVRHFKVPSVGASRIRQIIKYEAQQQVPFPLEEVVWDYQILEEDDKAAQEINIALVAVKSGLINDLLARISGLGIAVDLIEATSFAVFNCAKFNNVLDNGPIVLIDIGATSTDISVAKGKQLVFTRSIHIAGNDITKAIQKEQSIGFEDAEKAKFKKEDLNAAVSVLETLSGEIHRSISFYMSQMDRKSEFRKVVLTGQTSNLKEIAEFLSNNLKMEVVGLNPFSNILISNKRVLNIVDQNSNAWSVAIGSALTALGESDTKANLLPLKLITEKKLKKKRVPLIMSAVLLILIFITVHIFTLQSYTIKDSKLQRINDILKKYDSFIPRINELKEERTKIKQRLSVSKSVILKRDLWARTLMEISRLTPSSIVISQFSSTAKEGGSTLSAVGVADSYPAIDDFISRLKFSPYFEGVELINYKETKEKGGAETVELVKVQFELNLVLKKG